VLVLALLPLTTAVAQATGRININSADTEELALLPRVGPSVAGRIVEFREANGQFDSVEDLMLVRGIGEKTFEMMEPYVKLDGESDLNEKVSVGRSGDATTSSSDS
jgi:competence protein ComEA